MACTNRSNLAQISTQMPPKQILDGRQQCQAQYGVDMLKCVKFGKCSEMYLHCALLLTTKHIKQRGLTVLHLPCDYLRSELEYCKDLWNIMNENIRTHTHIFSLNKSFHLPASSITWRNFRLSCSRKISSSYSFLPALLALTEACHKTDQDYHISRCNPRCELPPSSRMKKRTKGE